MIMTMMAMTVMMRLYLVAIMRSCSGDDDVDGVYDSEQQRR